MSDFSWRAVLIALIVLLLSYVVVAFLRLRRIRRKSAGDSAPETVLAHSAVAAYNAAQDPEAPQAQQSPAAAEPAQVAFPWNEPPEETPGQQRIESLEREVARLRTEVGGLRAELRQVKDEFQREQSQAQATQNVSPLYNDAMQMAMQGHDATAISQHCGISRGEAELVVALARNPDL